MRVWLLTFLLSIPAVAQAGALPDLAIVKTAAVETAMVGEEITFTLVVTNGGDAMATGVMVTDRIPAGLDRVSVMTDVGSCMDGEPITCMLGDLAMGATATITIVTRATAAGRVTNMAGVIGGGSDRNTENNQSADSVDVSAGMPDAGIPPDGAVGDGGTMMMTEDEGGCGCIIPAGRTRVPGGVAIVSSLVIACVIAHRTRSRRPAGGHVYNRCRRRSG
jgi:uncharacterized repeat protein (TIGR01451 family)